MELPIVFDILIPGAKLRNFIAILSVNQLRMRDEITMEFWLIQVRKRRGEG